MILNTIKKWKKYGIGHAIESAKEKLADEVNVEIERQHFAEIIKDPNPNRRFKNWPLLTLMKKKWNKRIKFIQNLLKGYVRLNIMWMLLYMGR